MRLGQLARKLTIRQSDIIDFLLQRNISIDENSNTRLEDEHVMLIMKHYAPTQEEEVREALAIEKTEPESIEVQNEIQEIESIENGSESIAESLPDVIRVPKIELSGLKVIGKIELPEPKKKESESSIAEPTTAEGVEPERKNAVDRKAVHHKKPRRELRQGANPIAQQREREAREAAEKRRLEVEREKEKRKQHYHNKVKSIRTPKSVKPAEVDKPQQPQPVEKQPTTLLGRFWRWLRYDH